MLTSGPLPDQTDMAGLAQRCAARGRVRASWCRLTFPAMRAASSTGASTFTCHRSGSPGAAPPRLPVGDDDRRRVQQPDQLDAHRQRDRCDRRVRQGARGSSAGVRLRRLQRQLQQRHRMCERAAGERGRPPDQRRPPVCYLAIRRLTETRRTGVWSAGPWVARVPST